VIFPVPYFEFTMDTVRAGLAACGGSPTEADIDGWVETILARRQAFLDADGVTGPAGCLKVVVAGEADGEEHAYTFSFSSSEGGAGEGTGIPAALAAILVRQGKIAGPGVHPPEAIVPPLEMLALVPEVLPAFGFASGDDSPLHVDHRLPDGSLEPITLS
jgi:saccharopine dehydrogenase (NAD+, L-lysine-forming)